MPRVIQKASLSETALLGLFDIYGLSRNAIPEIPQDLATLLTVVKILLRKLDRLDPAMAHYARANIKSLAIIEGPLLGNKYGTAVRKRMYPASLGEIVLAGLRSDDVPRGNHWGCTIKLQRQLLLRYFECNKPPQWHARNPVHVSLQVREHLHYMYKTISRIPCRCEPYPSSLEKVEGFVGKTVTSTETLIRFSLGELHQTGPKNIRKLMDSPPR